MIPIGTNYRMRRRPWVNYALVAVNVVVYVLGWNGARANLAEMLPYLLHPESPRLYQFFSSMFMHGSLGHLLGNMVFLWVLGNAMNDRFGQAGYLAFYLGGGMLAGIGYLLLSPNAPVLGASGAISAVTGAYLVLLPRVRVTLLAFLFYVIMPLEVSSLLFLGFQLVWNFLMSFSDISGIGAGGGVAYVAHSSGYLFGIVVAAGMLAARLLPRDPFDLLSLLQGWRRRGQYRRMVNRGFDPFRGAARPARERWGGPSRRVAAKRVDASERSDTPQGRELTLRKEIAEACARHDTATAAQKYLDLIQIAEGAVLAQPQQLDVANHLMAAEQYPAAADAYERFLRHYPTYEHAGDIQLMLGIIYGQIGRAS